MLTQTQPMCSQAVRVHQAAYLQENDGVIARLQSLTIVEQVWDLQRDRRELTIGRNPQQCDIVASDKRVSGTHARIYRDDCFRFFIQAPGQNGAWLNEHFMKCGDTRTLHHGDKLSLCVPGKKTKNPDGERPFAWFLFEVVGSDRDPSRADGVSDGASAVGSGASSVHGGPAPTAGGAQQSASSTGPAGGRDRENTTNLVTEEWIGQNWDIRTVLGSGNFSEVKLGVHVRTGRTCAVKVMDKSKFKQFQCKRESHLSLFSEAEVMTSLQHPGLVRCFEWFQTERSLYLIMEILEGGDLLQCILENGRFTEPQARRLFSQLCEAVHYLHARNIVHRDLKPENILLTSKDREAMRVKIADFGLARKNKGSQGCRTFCGTPHYFAPEVINAFQGQQNGQPAGYGTQADLWSLGVVLYILLSGIPPFEEDGLYEQILEGKYEFDVTEWTTISPEAKDLVSRLMTVNPKDRLTIKEASEHRWLRFGPGSTPLRHPGADPEFIPDVCMGGEPDAKRRRTFDDDASMPAVEDRGRLGA